MTHLQPLDATVHRSTIWRTIVALALSVASGIMLTLAFAPYNLWALIFIAFIPLMVAQMRVMPKRFSSLSSAVMIATWLYLYFGPSFFQGGIMLALPVIGFLLNLFVEKGLRNFHDNTGYRWFILYGALNWVGFEIIRTLIPGIATWGFVGYTLWNQTWLIQPISIFGIYGLCLLIMFINYGLSQWVLMMMDTRWRFDLLTPIPARATHLWLVGIGLACVIWVGLSLVLYNAKPTNPETVRVAAIQSGVTEVAFQNPDMDAAERLTLLAGLTREAAAQGAQIIVWSELVLPFDPQVDFTEEVRALAAETGAYLVMPYGLILPEGIRNESVTLAPDGEFFNPPYAKAHPVLFAGEAYGLNVGVFPTHQTPIGKLATIICYDLNYTDITRIMAQDGAQIIAAPSNDWPGIAEKQNIHLVFRAIETRTAIIKAESAYDSAIVDPYGHILEQTVSLSPSSAVLIQDVPLGTADTPYLMLGDWLGWVAFAGLIFFSVFAGKLEKRALSDIIRQQHHG